MARGRQQRRGGDLFLETRTNVEHWLVVRTAYGKVIDAQRLPPGTDLVATFLEELLRYHRSGWKLHGFGSASGEVHASKDGDQRHVAISHANPSA
jgi:hypothetical protein